MNDVLVRELAWRTPEQSFSLFAGEDRLVWFDSQAAGDPRGRYSMLCIDPFDVVEEQDGQVLRGGRVVSGDPFTVLQAILQGWPRLGMELPVPFGGGAAGFFGYGLAHYLERLPAPRSPMPDDMLPTQKGMWIGLYDIVLGFDHHTARCWLISSGLPEIDPAARHARARRRLDAFSRRLEAVPAFQARIPLPPVSWHADLDPDVYKARVGDALAFIRAGDMFQVNLTTRHVARTPPDLDAASIHLALRRESPAPFGAFLRCSKDFAIACASPERFLGLTRHGRIETRPIKGTRARHADPATDMRARDELSASEKDRAENLMIVDLMRNDVGRVAVQGSVHVEQLQQVESFASVHHMVSSVGAQLRADLDAVGLLRACFPGGSVTGAPKIRAMEIIHLLEPASRGAYCGTIAWIGLDGAMDSNIVIRSLVLTGDQVIAQAGGAIVADSDPGEEHAEMLTKLAPLRAIFGKEVVA